MARPRTTDPPEGMIFPQGKGGYTWRPLPDTDPQLYEMGSVFGGISSVVTREHNKGDVTVFGDRTTFPDDFRRVHGEAPRRELFGTSKEEHAARSTAQKRYTDWYAQFDGQVDTDVAFGDDADEIEKRIAELAAALEGWGLGEPVLYRQYVPRYRFAFPSNPIMRDATRTMVPFHATAKPALVRNGWKTVVANYQVALIESGVIVERPLIWSLARHPAAAENSRLKAARDKADAEALKELEGAATVVTEDPVLALL